TAGWTDGLAHHLAAFIDAEGQAESVSGERTEISDARRSRPSKGMKVGVAWIIAGQVGKADDFPAIVDCRRCVPGDATEVADVGRPPVLPEDGVLGAQRTDRFVAGARDADDLASIVDRCRGGVWIAGQWRKRLHLVVGPPDDRLELKHLRRDAGRIVERGLRPAD